MRLRALKQILLLWQETLSQELSRGKTNLKVQGTLFRMTNESAEVYCDGTTKWIINEQAAEVTIIKNDLPL